MRGWPLARGKFCLWFGEGTYDPDGAHYGTVGIAHDVKNTRGTYHYKPDPRGKHLSTVYQEGNTRQFAGHAHSKPFAWIKMLLANCTTGDVFDPFSGSGVGILACEQLERRCFAMEVDSAAVAVILERLVDAGLEPVRASG